MGPHFLSTQKHTQHRSTCDNDCGSRQGKASAQPSLATGPGLDLQPRFPGRQAKPVVPGGPRRSHLPLRTGTRMLAATLTTVTSSPSPPPPPCLLSYSVHSSASSHFPFPLLSCPSPSWAAHSLCDQLTLLILLTSAPEAFPRGSLL